MLSVLLVSRSRNRCRIQCHEDFFPLCFLLSVSSFLLELVFARGVRIRVNSSVWGTIQVFQHHLLKRCPFLPRMVLVPFSKIDCFRARCVCCVQCEASAVFQPRPLTCAPSSQRRRRRTGPEPSSRQSSVPLGCKRSSLAKSPPVGPSGTVKEEEQICIQGFGRRILASKCEGSNE